MMAPMRVPLMDLVRQYATIKEEVLPAIQAVIESQQVIGGPAVKRFEENLGRYAGAGATGVGVASGSEALVVSLMALGVGPGDEVITTPHTFYATAASVVRVGAKPVFVDIDPATMNIDPARIEKAVTSRAKAVIPVHLYGLPADMAPILDVARRRKLAVVEDCAQAIGAAYQGRRVGTLGTVGCFSAYPAKNLGAFGDAGFVVSTDPALAARIAQIRDNGSARDNKYRHELFGYNARLDAIQAAVLDVKLRRIDAWNARRAEIARRYTQAFSGLDLVLPASPRDPRTTHVYHLYAVRTPRCDEMSAFLKERGVESRHYYPIPLHIQDSLRFLGYGPGDFPLAEKASAENLAIPLFPEMTEAEEAHVVASVRAFFGR